MDIKLIYILKLIPITSAPILLGILYYFYMKIPLPFLNRKNLATPAGLLFVKNFPHISIAMSALLLVLWIVVLSMGYSSYFVLLDSERIATTDPTLGVGALFGMLVTLNIVCVSYWSYDTIKGISEFKTLKSKINSELQNLEQEETPV